MSGSNQINLTGSGRASGSSHFEDFECSVTRKIVPSEQHLLQKIAEMREELKSERLDKSNLLSKVNELKEKLREKQKQILSLTKRNSDLVRNVDEIRGQGEFDLKLILAFHFN